jgi:hypothetical protein
LTPPSDATNPDFTSATASRRGMQDPSWANLELARIGVIWGLGRVVR